MTEDTEGRWIPVSERLPKTPSGEWEIHGVCVLAWSQSNGHDTAWFERDDEYGDRWSWECVSDPTHWMPLPEPPEADPVLADATPVGETTRGEGSVHGEGTLTAAEREAIERATNGYVAWMEDNVCFDTPEVQAVLYRLRGLLERLQ